MTPQELKNSILQRAIQGKLVAQRPEEGTGERLYQQIQEEKAALIKAKKNKKEKSLPEISEDEIGFLALHLANALDSNKRTLNTLLVSDNGLGINELLIERINTLVPYITVNNCVDILEVADVTLN